MCNKLTFVFFKKKFFLQDFDINMKGDLPSISIFKKVIFKMGMESTRIVKIKLVIIINFLEFLKRRANPCFQKLKKKLLKIKIGYHYKYP